MQMFTARISIGYDSKAAIKEVEVDRCTDKSVWINGHRQGRYSDWESFFATWDDAKQALLKRQQSHLDSQRKSLEVSRSVFGNIKGMKP